MPNHRCDVDTIDYSAVDDGRVWCRVCGRRWDLDLAVGWRMTPAEPAPARAR